MPLVLDIKCTPLEPKYFPSVLEVITEVEDTNSLAWEKVTS